MGKVHTTSIGAVAVTTIQDTWWMNPAAPLFHPDPNVDLSAYDHLLDANGLIELSVHSYLLDSQERRILIDTGWADTELEGVELAEPPNLPANIEGAGVPLDSIDLVVHTHLHADHVGWNTRRQGGALVPTFSNAQHVIDSTEWAFWFGGTTPDTWTPPNYEQHFKPLDDAGQIRFIDEDGWSATEEVSLLQARGHTPGHMAVRVESEGPIAYVLGDACHLPIEACEPSWRSITDVDPEAGSRTRESLIRRIDEEGALLLAGHFPFPGIGRRVQSGSRYDYEALD